VGSRITGAFVAELEAHLLGGARSRDAPPDVGRAGEVIMATSDGRRERCRSWRRRRDDVEVAGRQAALAEQQLGSAIADSGSARPLQHHRAAGRDRRRHLVGNEVEREVNGLDGATTPIGMRSVKASLPRRPRWHRSAPSRRRAAGLGGGERECSRPRGSTRRRLDRLGRLGGDDVGELSTRSSAGAPRRRGSRLSPRRQRAARRRIGQRALTARSTSAGVHAGTLASWRRRRANARRGSRSLRTLVPIGTVCSSFLLHAAYLPRDLAG